MKTTSLNVLNESCSIGGINLLETRISVQTEHTCSSGTGINLHYNDWNYAYFWRSKNPVWVAKIRIIRTGLPTRETRVQGHRISKLSLTTRSKLVYSNYLQGIWNSFRTFSTYSVLIIASNWVNLRTRGWVTCASLCSEWVVRIVSREYAN